MGTLSPTDVSSSTIGGQWADGEGREVADLRARPAAQLRWNLLETWPTEVGILDSEGWNSKGKYEH